MTDIDAFSEAAREKYIESVNGNICLTQDEAIARAIMAERERTAARLDRLEAAEAERDAARALLKRAGEALGAWPTRNDPAARAIHAKIKEAIDD